MTRKKRYSEYDEEMTCCSFIFQLVLFCFFYAFMMDLKERNPDLLLILMMLDDA